MALCTGLQNGCEQGPPWVLSSIGLYHDLSFRQGRYFLGSVGGAGFELVTFVIALWVQRR
jgi:hypothetical protein